MINYLKSEGYRVLRMKSVYMIPLFVLALLLFMLGLTWLTALGDPNFRYNNTQFIYGFSQGSLVFLIFIIPFLVNTIFADEYKNGTFKNNLSYGVSRITLYFGKLIMVMLVSMVMSVMILLAFIPTVELLMENSGASYRHEFIRAVISYIPLLLASLTLSHMLSFVTKKTGNHFGIYFLIVFVLPQILFFLQQLSIVIPEGVHRLFPYYIMANVIMERPLSFWGIFFVYFSITSIIGVKLFSRRDI